MTVKAALKLTASALALAAFGFAGSAMASPAVGTGSVNVNIHILPTVSVWGANADLTLDGSNAPDNSDAVASTITYINNVDANIQASVSGLPSATAGNGIQFHIFPNTNNTVAALAAIHSNQYGTVGALNFNYANQATLQTLTASTGIQTVAHNQNVVYAAGLPGDTPIPATWTAVVTYTITQN